MRRSLMKEKIEKLLYVEKGLEYAEIKDSLEIYLKEIFGLDNVQFAIDVDEDGDAYVDFKDEELQKKFFDEYHYDFCGIEEGDTGRLLLAAAIGYQIGVSYTDLSVYKEGEAFLTMEVPLSAINRAQQKRCVVVKNISRKEILGIFNNIELLYDFLCVQYELNVFSWNGVKHCDIWEYILKETNDTSSLNELFHRRIEYTKESIKSSVEDLIEFNNYANGLELEEHFIKSEK